MGVYDSVVVPCPDCGEGYLAQSKGGVCGCATYDLAEAPADVLTDVNRHAPFKCNCGCLFYVKLKLKVKTKVVRWKEGDYL